MNYHRLFEVLNARENRKATIIAAQIPRSDWYDLFRNDTYADAYMDRITKNNFLIELEVLVCADFVRDQFVPIQPFRSSGSDVQFCLLQDSL